jgi:hypothetical protein
MTLIDDFLAQRKLPVGWEIKRREFFDVIFERVSDGSTLSLEIAQLDWKDRLRDFDRRRPLTEAR